VLTFLVTILLLWAPLPFGGATPWAAAGLQVLCFSALALTAVAGRPSDLRPVLLPAAALAAVALLGFLQALPWPVPLVALLSPAHAELQRQAASVPGLGALGTTAAAHFTLEPSASRAAALSWAAAAAALLAGAAAGQRRKTRRWLAAAVLLGGIFQVIFGARNQFLRARTLWGVEIPTSPRLHGTFINPNHAALYLEIALAVAFAWGWWAARRAAGEVQLERKLLFLAGPVLTWLMLFIGLALTASRAGLLGAVAAVIAQGLLAAGARRRWRGSLLGLGAAAVGVIAVVATVGLRAGGVGRMLETRAGDASWGARFTEYGAVLDLWRRFPLTGLGLGAFRDAFPLVQPAGLQGTWWHAHSDALELLATAGLPGLLLLAVGWAALAWRLVTVLRGRGRSEDRAATLAALGILIAVTVHELLDFGLTMPANALTLAVLAGSAAVAETAHARAASAQARLARDHPPAADARELQKVKPRPEGDVEAERRRRSRRKRSKKRSVKP
jgi:O-antigen ligase